MKKFIIILAFFILFSNSVLAGVVSKDYKVVTKDGFSICATLKYPKIKEKKNFSTVVLLHALGYSSDWWEDLPDELLNDGYAVLLIDMRGHGKSIFSSNLTKVSWKNLTKNAYAKYPDDVISVITYVIDENKRKFFDNWAIVGSDIGASTAIYIANKMDNKPQTIVMLSPVVNAKGLYVPVKLAELDNIDILSITGSVDLNGVNATNYLEKFAQSTFAKYTADSKSTGMLMFKNDKSLSKVISSWIKIYLK